MFHLFDVNFGRIDIHSFHGFIYSTISRNRSVSKKQKDTPWLSSCHKSTQCLATISNLHQRHQVDRRRRSCFTTKLNQRLFLNCSQECVNFCLCIQWRVVIFMQVHFCSRHEHRCPVDVKCSLFWKHNLLWNELLNVSCHMSIIFMITNDYVLSIYTPSCVSFLWFGRNGMVNNATLYRRHCK